MVKRNGHGARGRRATAEQAEELQARAREFPGVMDLLRLYDKHMTVMQSATAFTNAAPSGAPSTSGANAR